MWKMLLGWIDFGDSIRRIGRVYCYWRWWAPDSLRSSVPGWGRVIEISLIMIGYFDQRTTNSILEAKLYSCSIGTQTTPLLASEISLVKVISYITSFKLLFLILSSFWKSYYFCTYYTEVLLSDKPKYRSYNVHQNHLPDRHAASALATPSNFLSNRPRIFQSQ